MTNGEKMMETFPGIELYKRTHLFINIDFNSGWWNAKYIEPTNGHNNTIEQIKNDILYDLYMAGVNMGGEYHGCWVRFKDIEDIINTHFRKELTDD